jgi:hypothetical protein
VHELAGEVLQPGPRGNHWRAVVAGAQHDRARLNGTRVGVELPAPVAWSIRETATPSLSVMCWRRM